MLTMPASNDNPVHVDPVHASTDALDNNDAAPRAKQFAPSVNTTACYQEEERFYRNHVKSTEKARATSVARRYERVLKHRYAEDPSFFQWDENRSLDRQNFDYLFYHRAHFKPWARTNLEIIASKLTHVTQGGEDGYFNKLQRNVGWTAHITPIVLGAYRYMDQVVRCGIGPAQRTAAAATSPTCALCACGTIISKCS